MPPIALTKPTDDHGTFFPTWDCFACQDSGTIPDHLARMIDGYESYDSRIHKNLRCRCCRGACYESISNAFDNSLTHEQMKALHEYNHQNWVSTAKAIATNDPEYLAMKERVEAHLKR